MQTVEELVAELLKLPMGAYIAVGPFPFDDIEITVRHCDNKDAAKEFDYISLD